MIQKSGIFLLIIWFSLLSCEKKIERIDDFFLEFATVSQTTGGLAFQLDNSRLLFPKGLANYKGKAGQRVILNYTLLKADSVKVNQVIDIHTDEVKELKESDLPSMDPVKIQSIWVAGNYLNFIFEVEYFDQMHKIGIVRDSATSPSELYFIHSREKDPPGYAKKMYASFLLTPLKNNSNVVNKFKLHIQTIDGPRIYEFEYQ